MEYCIFVNKSVSSFLHPLLSQGYIFADYHHNYNTRFASNGLLKIPSNNTSTFETSKMGSFNQINHLIKSYFFNFYDNSVT